MAESMGAIESSLYHYLLHYARSKAFLPKNPAMSIETSTAWLKQVAKNLPLYFYLQCHVRRFPE